MIKHNYEYPLFFSLIFRFWINYRIVIEISKTFYVSPDIKQNENDNS